VTRTGLARQGRARRPLIATAVLCLMAGAGCARSKPAAVPVVVALDVPPPPARVISTPPEPVAPTEATSVDRPAPASRPARAVRAAPMRPEPPRAAEPVRAEAPTDAAPTAAEPVVPSPGPLLQTPQTADESTAERRTRDVLKRATDLLAGVKAETLGQQARQQHDTARRFVEQAQQALNGRNYVLAASLADKAETLARGLSR